MQAFAKRFLPVTILITLMFCPLNANAKPKNEIEKVGLISITSFELAREKQRLLPFSVSFHNKISDETAAKINNDAMQNLLSRAYKVNYALDNNITVNEKEVDEYLEKIKGKYKNNSDFQKYLGKESLSEYKKSIQNELLAKKSEEIAVDNKIIINEKDLTDYYQENRAAYLRPKQYKASHILIKVDPSSSQETKAVLSKKAQELGTRAKNGEDFYNLAYYNSDDRSKYVGGDLGYFHEGQTIKEFEDALNKLKPGEISDPVRSMYGWHIIKLVEVKEKQQLTFEEAKTKIREKIYTNLRTKIYDQWINELKAKYGTKKQ